MRNIFWFRRDLRLEDNTGLNQAFLEGDQVIPVFIIDTNYLNLSDTSDARVYFLFDGIRELAAELKLFNSKLIIRSGNPAAELLKLAKETNSQVLYFNENYEPFERTRDEKVTDAFIKAGLRVNKYKDMVIFDREIGITSKTGLISFAVYKKKWLGRLAPEHYKISTIKSRDRLKLIGEDQEIYSLKLPNLKDLNFNLDQAYWKGGEIQAKKVFSVFFKEGIFNDSKPKSLLNHDGLFDLSPYFRFGNISIRKFLNQLMAISDNLSAGQQNFFDKWLDYIIKNDYFNQRLLTGSTGKEEKEILNPAWANNYQHFFSWCSGQTGYPIIDAAMNQLNKEAWLPAGLKKLTASFLVKSLRLDWKWGEKYFMHKLVDGDQAFNSAEWENIVSGKTKSFNLVSEGKEIDPSGEYIKLFLPQLKDIPEIYIHEPYKMPVSLQKKLSCIIGTDYPAPVVKPEGRKAKSVNLHKPRE
jgi:deoxyribodipyrimidine photo-lyase